MVRWCHAVMARLALSSPQQRRATRARLGLISLVAPSIRQRLRSGADRAQAPR